MLSFPDRRLSEKTQNADVKDTRFGKGIIR
jgi:hypothetical protein